MVNIQKHAGLQHFIMVILNLQNQQNLSGKKNPKQNTKNSIRVVEGRRIRRFPNILIAKYILDYFFAKSKVNLFLGLA